MRQEGLGQVHGGPSLLSGLTHRGLGIDVLCSMRMEPRECWAVCVPFTDVARAGTGPGTRPLRQCLLTVGANTLVWRVSRPHGRELCQFQKDTRDLGPQPWHDWHLGPNDPLWWGLTQASQDVEQYPWPLCLLFDPQTVSRHCELSPKGPVCSD